MARRHDPKNGRAWTPERVRQRIRTSMLLRRIHDHALGDVEMSEGQRKAAEFLLTRVIPRAEAPRSLTVDGTLTLSQLIEQSSKVKTNE